MSGSEVGRRVEGASVCAAGVDPESTCGHGLQATQCTVESFQIISQAHPLYLHVIMPNNTK